MLVTVSFKPFLFFEGSDKAICNSKLIGVCIRVNGILGTVGRIIMMGIINDFLLFTAPMIICSMWLKTCPLPGSLCQVVTSSARSEAPTQAECIIHRWAPEACLWDLRGQII